MTTTSGKVSKMRKTRPAGTGETFGPTSAAASASLLTFGGIPGTVSGDSRETLFSSGDVKLHPPGGFQRSQKKRECSPGMPLLRKRDMRPLLKKGDHLPFS